MNEDEILSEMNLTIEGTPPSVNQMYYTTIRSGIPIRHKSTKSRKYEKMVQKSIPTMELLTGELEVSIVYHFGTKRKVDVSNYDKGLLDALTGFVYVDDSQIKVLHLRKEYNKENPRTEIEIKVIV